jgi:multidrug efflux pump subunit AcrA (membrane-fusion protein)
MSIDRTGVAEDGRKSKAAQGIPGGGATRTARRQLTQAREMVEPSGGPARKKRRKRKRRLALLFLLFFPVAVVVGWWWYAHRASDEVRSDNSTVTVTRRDFSSSVLATGAVQAQVGAEVRVGARLSGKVERLLANIGDNVRKGQTVAELEKADLEAVVGQRQAELDLAQAKLAAVQALLPKETEKAQLDLDECQATYTLNEKELGRQAELHARGVATDEELDEAQERHSVSKARVAAARKALELAETRYAEEMRQGRAEVARAAAALENASVQLSYATITAPIDGVIASVSTEEGETVAAGMQTPTFVTIIDLQRLQVDAYVDEVDIGKVKVGQRAVFTVDAFPALDFQGRVSAIYPKAVIQDNVVYYDVVVDIETSYHGLLRPEMTASVSILLERREDVLAVPAKAVQRERGKNVVYVIEDDRTESREIKAGWRDGQWIEVASGLEEGETVLLSSPRENEENEQGLP